MKISPFLVLSNLDAFWEGLQREKADWKGIVGLLGFVVLACGLYGAVMAGWRSPQLSLFVAVKLPLLFLATIAIVAVFNWMTATILRSGLSFKATFLVVLGAMSITSWILLSLVPVALFFLLSGVPQNGTAAQLQYAHNSMLLTHITILALAGVCGNAALLSGLRRIVDVSCPVNKIFCLWLAAFAFVGCQMSWILRPFIGSPFFPVEFLRADCLNRNFYEFLFSEVIPFLLKGGN